MKGESRSPKGACVALGTAALCAMVVAVLGMLSTDLGTWYAGLRRRPGSRPILVGPGLDADLRAVRPLGGRAWRALPALKARRWLLVAWSANACPPTCSEPALLPPAPARLGAGPGGPAVAVGPDPDRAVGPRIAALGRLLVPYLAWVSFAATLNRAVVELNGPFGNG